MSRLLVLVLWLASVGMSYAQQKEVCVTVDDLPVVNYGKNDPEFLKEVTEKLIATFETYSISAIGYVNESKLYKDGTLDESRVMLLENWLNYFRSTDITLFHKMRFYKILLIKLR